jgi:hypothetical protein
MMMMMVTTKVMIKLMESRRGTKELGDGDHVHPQPRQPIVLVLPVLLATIIIYASNQHRRYHFLPIRMWHRLYVRLDELQAGH